MFHEDVVGSIHCHRLRSSRLNCLTLFVKDVDRMRLVANDLIGLHDYHHICTPVDLNRSTLIDHLYEDHQLYTVRFL